MDWRRQARALYRLAKERGLHPHPQVLEAVAWAQSAVMGDPLSSAVCGVANNGVEPLAGWRPAIACSGGADSLTLLLWLYGAVEDGWLGVPVVPDSSGMPAPLVLHLDHGLRGDDSRADALFVQGVATALGWPFRLGLAADYAAPCRSADGGARQGQGSASCSEAELRRWRQAFFAQSGCTHLFQGHQREDVAETVLMRLARGSGLAGLAAPRPVSSAEGLGRGGVVYLRPLLDWPREQIVALLRDLVIPWREDASNATGAYFRNRIRRDVLPVLAAAAPERDVAAAIASVRTRLQEDAEALDAWVEQLWQLAARPADRVAPTAVPTIAGSPPAEPEGSVARQAEAASGARAVPSVRDAASCVRGAASSVIDWSVFAVLPRGVRRRVLWRLAGECSVAAELGGSAADTILATLEASAPNAAGVTPTADGEGSCGGASAVPVPDAATADHSSALHSSALFAAPALQEAGSNGDNGYLRFSFGRGHFLVFCPRRQWLWVEAAEVWHRSRHTQAAFASATPVPSGAAVTVAGCGSGGGGLAGAADNASPWLLTPGSVLFLPDGAGSIGLEHVPVDEALLAAVRSGRVPCGTEVYLNWPLSPVLRVRFWNAGDAYRPLGAPGRRKLQDCFTDRKIAAHLRRRLPIVTDVQGGDILWVAGLPPADSLALANGTKWALRLTYTPSRKTVPAY